MSYVNAAALLVIGGLLAGCAGGGSASSGGASRPLEATMSRIRGSVTLPQHVIVVVQENRSLDNLFQTLPGADTQSFGYASDGTQIPLARQPLGAPYDPDHAHATFVTEFANGGMNGFNLIGCSGCPPNTPYSYVDPNDIVPYTQLATQYALADHVFQQNEGPSFPAHVYLVSGQSGTPGSHWYVSENPLPEQQPNDCMAKAGHTVEQIDMTTAYPGTEGNAIAPCVDPRTIFDELNHAGIEWRYYTPSTGNMWTAPYAVHHLYENRTDRARVVVPETTILSDIQSGKLAPVSYVVPRLANSDHAGPTKPTGGPAWVASIVNAVGATPYWQNTAIIVVWDDWGGWFDHMAPTHPNDPFGGNPDPYEYGFRVPLLAIGATARPGLIDHTPRSGAAILHFIEDVFALPSLHTLDAQTDDLFALFDFGAHPRVFRRIPTGKVTIEKLEHLPPDSSPVDD